LDSTASRDSSTLISKRLKVIELIRKHQKSGKSFQQIATWLNDFVFPKVTEER
jgi:hypothetical protein